MAAAPYAACHSHHPAESTGSNTTNNMSANTPDTPTPAPTPSTATPAPTPTTAKTPPEGECSNNRFLASV